MSEPGSSALVVPVSPLRMRLLHLTTGSMLATIVLLSIFFVFDPPLDFQDFLRILQQVLPIFIGFLLSAISYATGNQPAGAIEKERFGILKKVLDSAFLFYWIGVFLLTLLFAYSHSRFAVAGKGMGKDVFFGVLTLLLSVITGAAGAIATKIFLAEYRPAPSMERPKDQN